MKAIQLIPDAPFYNSVDISVMDFPNGTVNEARRRCKITAEFAEYDVRQLQERGLDFEAALAYYSEWIYNTVKFHISQDWECIGGMDETLAIIKGALQRYYKDSF